MPAVRQRGCGASGRATQTADHSERPSLFVSAIATARSAATEQQRTAERRRRVSRRAADTDAEDANFVLPSGGR